MEQVLKLARTGKVIIPIALLVLIGAAYAYVTGLPPEAKSCCTRCRTTCRC